MIEKKPFSIILLILAIATFFSYHIYYYWVNRANDSLVQNYYQNNKKEEVKNISVQKIVKEDNKEEYLGILSIQKLNLKLGFYDINSNKNDVSQNIQLLKESVMPDIKGGTIYFAAHSGSSYISYFNNLDKLTNDDKITINYQNKEYQYVINNIYEMPKNGKIEINKNIDENYLVLTTCSKNKNMQLIITSKLLDIN